MKLIIGLGNPGRKYKKTRHNIGFMVIDELKRHIFKKDTILLKPQTFMNQSGKEVKSVIKNCKLKIENLIVVHDDIDLLFGSVRVSKNSSSAGHKGVQSIINEIGTQAFTRLRIGIRQETKNKKQKTDKFVLEEFTKEEKKKLKKIIQKAIKEIKKNLASNPVSELQIPSQK